MWYVRVGTDSGKCEEEDTACCKEDDRNWTISMCQQCRLTCECNDRDCKTLGDDINQVREMILYERPCRIHCQGYRCLSRSKVDVVLVTFFSVVIYTQAHEVHG